MQKIKEFLILFLFFFPSLFFLVNITKNPYFIQGVIIYFVISLLVLIFVSESWLNKKIVLHKPNSVEASLLIFCFICALSWVLAFLWFPQYKIAVFSEGSRAFLLLMFACFLVFYIPIYLIKNDEFLERVFGFIFFAAIISSIYGIFQSMGIELIWSRQVTPFGSRCVSTFGNPDFISSYLILLLPISIHKFFSTKKSFYKILWVMISIIMLTTLFSTSCRSSMLGLVIGMLVYLYFYLQIGVHKKRYFIKVIVLVVVLSSSIIYFSPQGKEVMSRIKESFSFNQKNQAIYQRLLIWNSGMDMFLDKPITGVGWGLFELMYPEYQGKHLYDKKFSGYRTHANNAHNEILEQLSQIGILGFGIFIWFLICFFNMIIKIFNNENLDKLKRMEFIAILSSVIAMLVDNMLNVSLHFIVPMMIFWFLVGVAVRNVYKLDKNLKYKTYDLNITKKILFALIICFLIIVNFKQIKFFLAEKNYFKGAMIENKKTTSNINLNSNIILSKKYFESAEKQHEYEVNNLYELGNVCVKLGLFKEAIVYYKKAISANFGYDEIHFNLGVIYYKEKDFVNARKSFEDSFKLNPNSFPLMYALGNADCQDAKFYDEGIKVFERVVNLDKENSPSKIIAYNNLGVLYSIKGDWDKAILNYKKVLENAPNFIVADKNLKLAYQKKRGEFFYFEFSTR
jgi:tetratricopeptide (TPR) repeat protein